MGRPAVSSWLLSSVVSLVVVGAGSPPLAVAAGEAPASEDVAGLSLVAANSVVELAPDLAAQLVAALTEYFGSCHAYESVVFGGQSSQADLQVLWTRQVQGTHALLGMTGAADSRQQILRGERLTVLFGFGSESESGPFPVLTRDEDGTLERYIKCPGLQGLLLACRVHEIAPGREPSPDCERWREIDRGQAATAVLRAYADAWRSNDPDALRALLAPDVVLMPTGLAPIEGVDAAMAFWFPDDGPTTRITAFDMEVDEALGSEELAVVRARSSFSFTYEKDGEVSEHTSRTMSLTVLRRQDSGEWLIARRMWGTRGE